MSSSTNLLGFDQVVALSQQTINSQLSFTWQQSLVDFVFTLDVDADNYVNATCGIPVVNVNLSTPGEVNYSKVILQFPLTGGSAQGVSFGTTVSFDDLTGYTIQVGVDLGSANPLDADAGLAVPGTIQSQLALVDTNIYSISSVILDIDNINYTDSDCVVLDPEGNEVSELESMISSFIGSIQSTAGGNPFLLVFNQNLLPEATAMAGIPAFYPTSALYRTEFVNADFSYSQENTINLMIMTQDDTAPTLGATQGYPVQLGPGTSPPDGMMYICADQFNTNYIQDLMLKTISDSIQHSMIKVMTSVTTNATAPTFNDTNLFVPATLPGFPEQLGWGLYWSYEDGIQGDTSTYGSSPVIGSDSGISDIHQVTQIYCSCSVSMPVSSSDQKSIEMTVSGYVKVYGNWYEDDIAWIHDGQILVAQDFSTKITIQPAASDSGTPGALVVSMADITTSPGTVTNDNGKSYTSPHTYENALGSLLDFIAGIFGASTFKEISDDFEADANSAINDFFSDFQDSANAALATLSSNVIMPTGDAYLFQSVQLDSESNPKLSFTINSF